MDGDTQGDATTVVCSNLRVLYSFIRLTFLIIYIIGDSVIVYMICNMIFFNTLIACFSSCLLSHSILTSYWTQVELFAESRLQYF